MLVGYNTNVRYKDKVYHIQTEDNGIDNPVIVTFLYYQGAIIASRKTNYANIINEPDYKEKVAKIMKVQHKYMIRELLSGRLTMDDEMAKGELMGKEDVSKDIDNKQLKEFKDEDKEKSSKNMDDILLNFILKRVKS
jgi:hypothetical protein